MEEIIMSEELLKDSSNKNFYRGYTGCLQDLINAISNGIEESINISVYHTEEGYSIEYSDDEYNALSTLEKIQVELYVKAAKNILEQMTCFEIEMFEGLKEGEES